MKNNKFFVSVDFEDWYHLPYLDKYGFKKDDFDFSDFLEYTQNKTAKGTNVIFKS